MGFYKEGEQWDYFGARNLFKTTLLSASFTLKYTTSKYVNAHVFELANIILLGVFK